MKVADLVPLYLTLLCLWCGFWPARGWRSGTTLRPQVLQGKMGNFRGQKAFMFPDNFDFLSDGLHAAHQSWQSNPLVQQLADTWKSVSSHVQTDVIQPRGWKANAADTVEINASDLRNLLQRIDKLERSLASISSTPSTSFAFPKFSVDTLAGTVAVAASPIDSVTVDRCGAAAFAIIGALMAASIRRTLWILGALSGVLWANITLQGEGNSGQLVRRLGTYIATALRNVHEKYSQALLFYRTGQLAYISSKWWVQYDQKYLFSQRFQAWRKEAIERAAAFNRSMSSIEARPSGSPAWQVALGVPITISQSIAHEYQLPSRWQALQQRTKRTVERLSAVTHHFAATWDVNPEESVASRLQGFVLALLAAVRDDDNHVGSSSTEQRYQPQVIDDLPRWCLKRAEETNRWWASNPFPALPQLGGGFLRAVDRAMSILFDNRGIGTQGVSNSTTAVDAADEASTVMVTKLMAASFLWVVFSGSTTLVHRLCFGKSKK